MATVKLIETKINELDNSFNELLINNQLNIDKIENLAINSVEECKQIINNHIEKLILSQIDEKQIIIKKQEWKENKLGIFFSESGNWSKIEKIVADHFND